MTAFIDPRTNPKLRTPRPPAPTTADPGTLAELHRLCRESRLYHVEVWIRAGRPVQAAQGVIVKARRLTSALEIALEARNQALVLLLLCNGYDPNLEPRCPLDLALHARRWDLLDLLLEWGADPHRVCLSDLFDTYNSELFERFRVLGVALTANHKLAAALAYHPGNKPLFGFAKRQREDDPRFQKELNIALGHHASEGNEKGVQLCLWAGADPHAPAPSLRYPDRAEEDGEGDEADRFLGCTAIEEACSAGEVEILKRLGPDPSRDNFAELYRSAKNGGVVDVLARLAPPKNLGAIIRAQLWWLQDSLFFNPRSVGTLERIFEAGPRWKVSSGEEIADVRRALLKLSNHAFVDAVKLLARDEHCAPTILQALARTPAVRERMAKVGFMLSSPNDERDSYRTRPMRSREVLSKFGVALPKAERRLPRTAEISSARKRQGWTEIGSSRRAGREIRLDRTALFDRVWSEPVEKLAKAWGLSGRGLAKVCQRLKIPVPPRGYWAKVQHGQRMRRPRLPELQPGEAEEIVVHVRESTDGQLAAGVAPD